MPSGWLTGWQVAPLPWAGPAVLLALYAAGDRRLRRRGRRWSASRTASFVGGSIVVMVALCSPLAARDELFPVHMVQHLLIGMLAPLLFALSGPVTLALRTLPPVARRRLVRLLHSRVMAAFAFPPVATLIYVGSLWVLYLTPLFALTLRHPLLHGALHFHFLLVGCLFAWPLVGVDPVRSRGSMRLRVAVLLFALGAHGALAKLIYAGWLGGGLASTLPAAGVHKGAQLMYYGGDVIDLARLLAFFAQWYASGTRVLARDARVLARASAAPPAQPGN